MKGVFIVIHPKSLFLSPCFIPGWSAADRPLHESMFLSSAINSMTICYGDTYLGKHAKLLGTPQVTVSTI